MNVKVEPLKVATKLRNNQIMKIKTFYKTTPAENLSLNEMQSKEYPFMDSDVPTTF